MRLFGFGWFALAACGGSASGAHALGGAPVSAVASRPAVLEAPSHSLRRSEVDHVVCSGFGAFLETVTIDPRPAFVGGRFHGFRIAALGPPWGGIPLQPGDVVTRVNGMPIERPEQALEVFQSLQVASELHVDYEHDGEPREMRYAILDDGAGQRPCDAGQTEAH